MNRTVLSLSLLALSLVSGVGGAMSTERNGALHGVLWAAAQNRVDGSLLMLTSPDLAELEKVRSSLEVISLA